MERRRLAPLAVLLAVGTAACGAGSGEAAIAPGARASTTTLAVTSASGDPVAVEQGGATAGTPTAVPPPSMAPTSEPARGTSTGAGVVVRSVGAPDPAATVAAWLTAVAQRDTERAWALMHEASRSAFAGPDGFADADAGNADGYGMWATATEVRSTTVALPAAGEAVSIVVVSGTVAMEGGHERMAGAVPVRTDADGDHQVDPFQDLLGEAGIEYGVAPGTAIERDHTFEVELSGDVDVSLLVDGDVIVTTARRSGGDRQRVSGSPARDLPEGEHTFTVVVERDGAVQARSTLYSVVG